MSGEQSGHETRNNWLGFEGPSSCDKEEFGVSLRYLHTMVRVTNIDQSLDFYCKKLGMEEVRRVDSEAGKYTLVFLAAPADKSSGVRRTSPVTRADFQLGPRKIRRGPQLRSLGL